MKPTPLLLSLLAWVGVWTFWLVATRSFHPLFSLALVVTTSLVAAYAAAAYVNHLVLIPRFLAARRIWQYCAWLAAMMCGLTAAALVVIRIAYASWWGEDPDPIGAYKHFLIDLFGMAVHLFVAARVVSAFKRLYGGRRPGKATVQPSADSGAGSVGGVSDQ